MTRPLKPFLLIMGVTFVCLVGVLYFVTSTHSPETPEERANKAATLDAIEREVVDGKVVLDAHMQAGGVLWLGVIDDGTDRYGLAMYGCEVLRQHHVRGGRVKIMDAVAAKRDEFRELKTVFCK